MKYLLLILMGLFQFFVYGQYPKPRSIMEFPYGTTKNTIQQGIENRTKYQKYSSKDWSNVEASVKTNNDNVNLEIRELKGKLREISDELQALPNAEQIIKLIGLLEAENKKKTTTLELIEKELQVIDYEVLYMGIVVKASEMERELVLKEQIQNEITPNAIEQAKGAFIKSLTVVEDNRLLYDYVSQKISGQIEPDDVVKTFRPPDTEIYVEIRRDKVYSLLDKEKASMQNSGSLSALSTNVTVINLVSENDYIQRLQSVIPSGKLQTDVQDYLQSNLSPLISNVEKYNSLQEQTERKILAKRNSELNQILGDINEHEKQLLKYLDILNKMLENYSLPKIDRYHVVEKDLTAKLVEIENRLKKEAKDIIEQQKQKGSNYLITRLPPVSIGTIPAQNIAQSGLDVVEDINKTETSISKFLEEIDLEDGSVTKYSLKTGRDVFKQVETFWFYPIPTSEEQKMNLGIVVKFKVTGVKDDCEVDDDKDGVVNCKDSCVDVRGEARFSGCPNPDRDADGFRNWEDDCPDTFGESFEKGQKGCPLDTASINQQEREKKILDEGWRDVRESHTFSDGLQDGFSGTFFLDAIWELWGWDSYADYSDTYSANKGKQIFKKYKKTYPTGKHIQYAKKGLNQARTKDVLYTLGIPFGVVGGVTADTLGIGVAGGALLLLLLLGR